MLAQTAVQILAKLVSFDTTSHLSNLLLIEWVEGYLAQYGISSQRIDNVEGTKANLLVTIGPQVEGGLIMSGHTDVVPVVGQEWQTDPFTLTAQGDTLVGRGTSDMKSFLACCLALVPQWTKAELKKPIHLAFSYDEEVGCLGAPALVSYLSKHLPRPELAIIGEPTMMQAVVAHKGVLSFETTITGLEAHSSQIDKGVNAVQYGARLVDFMSDLADDIAAKGQRDERFDPPYTTVHVGMFHGGVARNIIPKICTITWEIRALPGDDTQAITQRIEKECARLQAVMRLRYAGASITTKPMSTMAAMESTASEKSLQRVMAAAQTNALQAVAYGTEAGIFQAHDIPAIVCGPGSIRQAHKPDEFIETSQIGKCLDFLSYLSQNNE